MRRQILKSYTLVMALLLAMIVTGCGGSSLQFGWSAKPDDDISKAIYKAIGRNKMYYQGKHYSNRGEIAWYEYTVHDYKDENVLTNMVEAANEVLDEKEMTEKVHLGIREEVNTVGGGTEGVASLSNYNENGDGGEKYESLQCLYILGTQRSEKGDSSPYNMPSTYINLPDIKSLVVSQKIAKIAEEEGIDWYEIWPDLEHYEVLEE